ncbi:MAG TPA: substrate-binding domain-containing protein [Bacteroidales bacterium]
MYPKKTFVFNQLQMKPSIVKQVYTIQFADSLLFLRGFLQDINYIKFNSKMKLQTSIHRVIYVFCVMLVLTSCQKSGPTIGFMLPHMGNRRYVVEKAAFTKRVEELGGKVIFMSADNDEEKQITQAKEILKQGIDVLVLDPVNRFRAAEMIRLAQDKDVKVISYDRLVANCNVDALITFDPAAIGNQMTSYALSRRPEGKYIILGGDKSDINAVLVGKAVEKSLEPAIKSGKIRILYESYLDKYSEDDAKNELAACLKLSMEKPDAIITSGDFLANGAIDVLSTYGWNDEVLVTGQNGELVALKNILKNKQAMTVYKPVKKMATTTAEIAVDLSKGKKVKNFFKSSIFNGSVDVPSTFLDVITVDATNIKSTVIADGFYTDEEVFK